MSRTAHARKPKAERSLSDHPVLGRPIPPGNVCKLTLGYDAWETFRNVPIERASTMWPALLGIQIFRTHALDDDGVFVEYRDRGPFYFRLGKPSDDKKPKT